MRIMLETSEPKLNVKTIMEDIRKEINREISGSANNNSQLNLSKLEYIEALISNAEYYADTPNDFPDKLKFFPFNFTKIQQFILKIYGFIFKKQKVVNNSLTQAFKANLTLKEQLIAQVNSLNNALEIAQIKLQNQENILKLYEQQLKENKQEYLSDNTYLKNKLTQQERLLKTLIDGSPEQGSEYRSFSSPANHLSEKTHLLDAFYVALEDKFRGAREDIFERLKVYLPLIEAAKIGTNETPILDVGCGRGEWLELLQKNGYQAAGIDTNRVMVEQCQEKMFKVTEADVIQYLRSLPNRSLGGITGFHIIEHLPFEILMELFSETTRVLKQGGIAIFETPNPQNILVASYKFYIDPTHLHPLPSELVKFIAELQGLSKVQILNLHPYPDNLLLKGLEVAERFNEHFYSAQDYSVIGYKA